MSFRSIPIKRISSILCPTVVAALVSGCAQDDLDHFWGLDVQQGQQPAYQSAAPDPFYAEQNAKREANMQAVREQNYKNQMQSYQNGYTNTLPNY